MPILEQAYLNNSSQQLLSSTSSFDQTNLNHRLVCKVSFKGVNEFDSVLRSDSDAGNLCRPQARPSTNLSVIVDSHELILCKKICTRMRGDLTSSQTNSATSESTLVATFIAEAVEKKKVSNAVRKPHHFLSKSAVISASNKIDKVGQNPKKRDNASLDLTLQRGRLFSQNSDELIREESPREQQSSLRLIVVDDNRRRHQSDNNLVCRNQASHRQPNLNPHTHVLGTNRNNLVVPK